MTGADELIAMRMDGRVPEILTVDLDNGLRPACEGQLQVLGSDRVSGLNLSCVQGLLVSVAGIDPSKTKAVAMACKDAGASRVITTISRRTGERKTEVIEIDDTAGVMKWKA